VGFQSLFRNLEIDFLPPPPITKRTMELGARFSPEFVCLPFKINLGNFIEALNLGADVLFQSGGRGACRYGSYLEVQERILRDLGFNFTMTRLFDATNLKETWRVLKRLNPAVSVSRLYGAARITFAKIWAIDRIEDSVRRMRCRFSDHMQVDRLQEEFLARIDRAETRTELRKLVLEFEQRMNNTQQNSGEEPLKIGIVGELYVVMEPFSNMNLEKQLGQMNVEVVRPLCLSGMLKDFFYFGAYHRRCIKIAKPYLRFNCCAHSNVSVAEAIIFAKDGFDGLIHVKPHACMPEVTAMAAIRRVSKDHSFPALSFSFDEHTSEVGVRTRLEAFVELLRRRRQKKCTLV
jgi:predicted nucleotide-binding protein (sugar kinase/HSP70/actin superfamily)